MMFTLAIDTSGNDSYVALFEREKLIEAILMPDQMQTCLLLERIDLLLRNHSLSLDDLTIFAACTGPGSFTGIRIGVITAKTLAYAKSKPLIGYSAFIGRATPSVFIGKKKIASLRADGQIEYHAFDPLHNSLHAPVHALSQKNVGIGLDMSIIGDYIQERAGKKEEKLEIAYPEI